MSIALYPVQWTDNTCTILVLTAKTPIPNPHELEYRLRAWMPELLAEDVHEPGILSADSRSLSFRVFAPSGVVAVHTAALLKQFLSLLDELSVPSGRYNFRSTTLAQRTAASIPQGIYGTGAETACETYAPLSRSVPQSTDTRCTENRPIQR